MNDILFALWFFAPAGIANTAPVFAARMKSLERFGKPLDSGRTYRDKRIFGPNKTYRGLIAGVVTGIVVAFIQILIFNNNSWVYSITHRIDYSDISILLLGGLLGSGAIIGDAIKSFFKRQANVPAGTSWFPIDQVDYVIGGLLFSLAYVVLDSKIYALIMGFYVVIHVLVVYVGWLLHIRKDPI